MNRYMVPQNINRDYTVFGIFRLIGLFEGLLLGFITYKLLGLIPFPYYAVKLVFQLSITAGVFFVAAKGFVNYSITKYLIIIFQYFYHRADREFRRAFRLSKAKDKTTEDFTQGIVIEEELGNGIIKLKDGRYVAVVEVPAINFFTKTEDEQEAIIGQFERRLRTMPVKGQIITYTSPADPFAYINSIKKYEYKEENKNLKREYQDYYRLCRIGIGQWTVNQHFAVVFSSDALDQTYRSTEERIAALQRCASNFASEMGSGFVQDADSDKQQDNVKKMIFDIYNPMASVRNENAYEVRKKKVNETFKIYDKEVDTSEIPLSYYLAPVSFDDTASTRYVVVGDCYYSFYYIMQNTYPINGIYPGWLASRFQAEGVDYHLFYQKIDDGSYISTLNRTANLSRKLLGAQEKESILKSELTSVYEAAYFLKTRLERYDDPPYYMGVMISIHANNYQRLFDLEDQLYSEMRKHSIAISSCRFLEKEAYQACLLGNKVPNVLWKKMRQNVPASTLAAMYPFASSTLADKGGAFLGTSYSSAVFLDLFNSAIHANYNLSCFGSTGHGKSYALQAIAERMRLTGIEVYVVLPTKGYEWDCLCKALDGNMIRINSSSGQTINVMDIYPRRIEANDHSSLLYKKVESIAAFVRFRMPDMTPVETQILEKCIIETYAKFGITRDNESIWADEERTTKKKMPVLGDLVSVVEEYAKHEEAAKNLATIMQVFTTGTLSYFNNETNVDFSKGLTIFDLSDISSNTKTISMFATTELIQSYFENDRSRFKMIIVDEIWLLLENEGSASVVIDWAKTIRGKGGSLCFATQEVSDLLRAQNGTTLCTQADTRLLLGMTSVDAEKAAQLLYLPETVKERIKNRERGEGILMMNGNAVDVTILGTGHNTLVYTTDPALVRIRSDLQNEQEWKFVEEMLDEKGKSAEASEIEDALAKFRAARKKNQERSEQFAEAPKRKVEPEFVEAPVRKRETETEYVEAPVRRKDDTPEWVETPIRRKKDD